MAKLGFGAALAKVVAPSVQKAGMPVPVAENRGGWLRIMESFAGAWQRNISIDFNSVLSYHAIYACMTLIASDIAKLRIKLVERDENGIWAEVTNPAYSPVLRKPNSYQNRIQFWEYWILSKLARGNTYALKERDNRNVVVRLYILDPNRVKPMVADDGSVFYQLSADNMAGLTQDIMVPASEIIHDRMNCLFHPLVGTSPIFASGVAATQGLEIQNNATTFFANRSMPGGILTAPGAIADETAARLKEAWTTNYSGANAGKVAVVGDGLKFEPIMISAQESQMIEQLKWTAEIVCSTFHVPGYKIGVGTMPLGTSVESLNIEYYNQALHSLIEAAELCLDEGLGMTDGLGTEFDIDNLLRMDTGAMVKAEADAVGAGFKKPNEARSRMNLPPVEGGDTPYLQQQNFSLAALAKRDANDPFSKPAAPDAAPIAPPAAANDTSDPAQSESAAKALVASFQMKSLQRALANVRP